MKNNKLLTTSFLIIISMSLLIFVITCGKHSEVIISRSAQDSIPPKIIDLAYPEMGEMLPEGAVVITGTLVDYAEEGEPGFSEDWPVFLEIDSLGSSGVLRTNKFCAKRSDPDDPSFFDYDTGNFKIEFGEFRRMKPGKYDFRLICEDASGNKSDPIETSVISESIEGLELGLVYEARKIYGSHLLDLLGAYMECLQIYEDTYVEDIAFIRAFMEYILDTYCTSPKMDTWVEPAENLVQTVNELEYSDPIVKMGIDVAAQELLRLTMKNIKRKAFPFYPVNISEEEIIEQYENCANHYTNDLYHIDYDLYHIDYDYSHQGDGFSCHIMISLYDMLLQGEMTDVADFIIIADPDEDFEITGYVGSNLRRYYIDPEHYEHPIEFFKLFKWATLRPHLIKYW